MGMMKNYMLKLLEHCSVEQFGQDAIEWAVTSGRVQLSYNLDQDVRSIMPRYDEIIESYRLSTSEAPEQTAPAIAPMRRAGTARSVQAESSGSTGRRRNAA